MTKTKVVNYRKLVFDFCKANNLTIKCACRDCIEIDYPDNISCVANGWHSLYYPDLRSGEISMPLAWRMAWGDLKAGVRVCPLDCECYSW